MGKNADSRRAAAQETVALGSPSAHPDLPGMLTPAEAEAAVRTHAPVLEAISQPLSAITGSVLREPIRATRDQPPFDRVTMDGVAFSYSAYANGRRTFPIVGTQAAGAGALPLSDPEACLEVMTGAVLPPGCDCVVPFEKLSIQEQVAHLSSDAAPEPGLNIHRRGIDCRAGTPLLSPGTRLGPAEVAVIASNGYTRVAVSREPRIVIISTGDELVEPGEPLSEWQIYRSNAYAVTAALELRGCRSLGQDHLPDDLETLRQRLHRHLESSDVLILSGGVSMGRFDFVPRALQELGIRPIFHKIAQRPGKPMWFGVGSGGKTIYALPGNPVSTLVCLARYVYQGIAYAQGAIASPPERIRLGADFQVNPALTMFLPVCVSTQDGTRRAMPRPTQGSGDFTSLLGTDGFVELPPGPRLVTADSSLPFFPW